MILILEHHLTTLGAALETACAPKGLASLRLMPESIVRDVGVDFYVSAKGCGGRLIVGGREFALSAIKGVYCSLDSFAPSLWPDFSSEDAAYAAMETHAIWLALLSSLSCRLINPPAPEALGGAVYSPGELFLAAQRSSLHVASMACLGFSDAIALSSENIAVSVCDLGQDHQSELPLNSLTNRTQAAARRHIRMRERLPGPRMSICIVGRSMFTTTVGPAIGEPQPLGEEAIPNQISDGVCALHARLGFVLAEYQFVKLPNGEWIFDDHSRAPSPMTWAVHSEALVLSILDSILAQNDESQ